MSTRSLTVVINDGEEILAMYKHSDGYPKAHGAELKKILKGCVITNGISGSEKRSANGMGCLAGQIVGYFQGGLLGPDEIMLRKPGVRDVHVQYVYRVSEKNKKLWLVLANGPFEEQVYYSGWMDDFDPKKTETIINKSIEIPFE